MLIFDSRRGDDSQSRTDAAHFYNYIFCNQFKLQISIINNN